MYPQAQTSYFATDNVGNYQQNVSNPLFGGGGGVTDSAPSLGS